ncbi:MAG: NUDIX hydrolase [Balneolales bacterium]|nr:NUDIX hydrolase [Balneolales bacterium]
MSLLSRWDSITLKLKEETLEQQQVFKGDLLNVWRDRVKLPDGKESHREYIRHPGAAAVLPVFENGDILLVGQYRYPLRKAMLEVPAGKLDANEPPLQTATRELKEETGLEAAHIAEIGSYHPAIGFADEIIYLYAAWGLSQSASNMDDDEFLTHHRLPFAEAIELVHSGFISDSKTIICLLKGWHWWQKNAPFPVKG